MKPECSLNSHQVCLALGVHFTPSLDGLIKMIYFLGMSHVIPVLDACSANGCAEQWPKLENERAPEFVEWRIRPGAMPSQLSVAYIYIKQIAPHWGVVPARMLEPTVLGIAPGFQSLLNSINATLSDSILFTFMYGQEYVNMAQRTYNTPHDFQLPWRHDLIISPERQVLPYEIIQRQTAFHLLDSIANFKAIRITHPNLRIFNVICPPPGQADNFDNSGRQLLLLKYYLLYVKEISSFTKSIGIQTLVPPAESLTQDGYLKKEYIKDGVHGNNNYAELQVKQISMLSTIRG